MKRRLKRKVRLLIGFVLVVVMLLLFFWMRESTRKRGELAEPISGEVRYENCLILSVANGRLLLYGNGELREFEVDIKEELIDVLADVIIKEGKVEKISLKQDTIDGKILAMGADFIEVEGYGRIPLSPSFHVYEVYAEPKETDRSSILVGSDRQTLIVGDGMICGAFLTEELQISNIRVLLLTDHYTSRYHERLTITSDVPFMVSYGEEEVTYKEGESVNFTVNSPEFAAGRIFIRTQEEQGKLTISSLNRAQGAPAYYGSLELWKETAGILCINELSVERYLYSVVPSEMPVSYGVEALKAQAVCARSYAYRQMLYGSLGSYGAHVDDSTQYQVYNNQQEYPDAITAVEETKGQIMKRDGEIVEAYYFSTSCGHTTDADIWGEGVSLPYIQGREVKDGGARLDLTDPTSFASFIKTTNEQDFDYEFPWYRWEISFTASDIQERIAQKELVNIGGVTGMEVTRRGTGGIVKELTIAGTEGTVVIEKENAIRNFLVPGDIPITRKDGETIMGFSILPSGFFTIDVIAENGKETTWHLFGGGFGHGAGMSQNAVKEMIETGYSYQNVLEFFYDGITLETMYQ